MFSAAVGQVTMTAGSRTRSSSRRMQAKLELYEQRRSKNRK
jgi:hypothetical protein